jgi:predicted Rossmann fold flavoprotein
MKYDVAVIGGGPAGILAAGRAAELGARVVLIEKNDRLGKKLLITGKGRCNITHAEYNNKKLVASFGKNGKFLYQSLNKFGVKDIVDFLESYGVKTKVERGDRVFPVSDKSMDVLKALLDYLHKNRVTIIKKQAVKKMVVSNGRIEKLELAKQDIVADKFIIATGGLSYSATGCSGDGYKWAENVGHQVIEPKPALVPIVIKNKIVSQLEGLSLKNVNVSIFVSGRKKDERFGEALFTSVGMSGPIILDMSKSIGKFLNSEEVVLKIDFKPALDFKELDKRVQKDFNQNTNRLFRNALDDLLPKKMIPVVIKLSGINPNKKVNSVTKEERKKLLHLLKEFELEVSALAGFDSAIITTGGVNLSEVDPRTMKSKKIDNLYFAGEVLDIDGPTGGYNLQVCWSTGYLAGESATC